MPTAKTYENMTIKDEPYERNGKMYVKVVGPCSRCGGSGHYSYNQLDGTTCYGCRGSGKQVLEVRWYTESQRAALDRAADKRRAAAEAKKQERVLKFKARNALGFGEAGYITLYKGDSNKIHDHFMSFTIDEAGHRGAWYSTFFGWYTPSKIEVRPLPEGIEAIRLTWDEVKDENAEDDLTMKSNDEVAAYVKTLLGEDNKNNSEWQGEINDWLEKKVIVKKNISLSSRYGESHMHIMEDEEENVYVWTTASKNIEIDTQMTLRMKVKDHSEYNGVKQTIVYYCKEKK